MPKLCATWNEAGPCIVWTSLPSPFQSMVYVKVPFWSAGVGSVAVRVKVAWTWTIPVAGPEIDTEGGGPWILENADVGTGRVEREAALICGDAFEDASTDGQAAGEQRHGLGGPAIVSQSAELGIEAHQIAVHAIREAARGRRVVDQVVAA